MQQNCSDFHSVSFLSNTHPLETIQVILIPNLQIQTPRDLNISFDNEPTMIRLFISLNLRGGRREDHPGREIKAQVVVMMLCCGLTTVRDGWFIFGLLTGKRGCIETEFNVKKLFDKWSFSQSLSLCCATYLTVAAAVVVAFVSSSSPHHNRVAVLWGFHKLLHTVY